MGFLWLSYSRGLPCSHHVLLVRHLAQSGDCSCSSYNDRCFACLWLCWPALAGSQSLAHALFCLSLVMPRPGMLATGVEDGWWREEPVDTCSSRMGGSLGGVEWGIKAMETGSQLWGPAECVRRPKAIKGSVSRVTQKTGAVRSKQQCHHGICLSRK